MALSITSRLVGIFTLNLLLIVTCERAKEKMYETINGAFCFKRLNATHEFGCTSFRSGNTGVLHIIKEQKDFVWLIQKAQAFPYVVILPFDFPDFTETLLALKDSGKVSGIILTSNRSSFSPDDVCPNRYSGLNDNQCTNSGQYWNSIGSSLLFVDFGFPIMYIDSNEYSKDIKFLEECFEKHNSHDMESQSSRSLCAVELTSHMLAAVDSRTCIRRSTMINNLTPVRYCDPLVGLNIHLPLFPRLAGSKTVGKSKSVILVATRLDGTSMFDGIVPGAGSPILGIISLLMVAHILKNLVNLSLEQKDVPLTERNVIFVFFHGESYDYIGSSRMIYDMENLAFPHRYQPKVEIQSDLLKLEDIGLLVELDEVIKNKIIYHSYDSIAEKNEMVSEFIEALEKELNQTGLELSGNIGRLPPSSIQRFLKKDRTLKGVVLSSYNSSFDNMFYHSIFDTGKNLNYTYFNKSETNGFSKDNSIQKRLVDFSVSVARSLFTVLFNSKPPPKLNPNYELISLVDELLYCYLVSPSCEIFENVTSGKSLDDKPYPVYVGVIRSSNVTTLTGLTLAWLTGEKVSRNRSSCHNNESDLVHQYFWMGGDESGFCLETLMNYSLAQSPAFDIEDYDWTSREYSTWTESVWQEKMSARAFIKPSKKQEILTLSSGLLVFLSSFVIVYFISAKASILFGQQVLESDGC